MTPPLDTDVAIEAPEHIVFRYRVAGPARRLLAYLADIVICYLAFFILAFLVLFAAGLTELASKAVGGAEAGLGVVLVLLFAVQWVYFVAWEWTGGRTPGKMAAGLRVVTTEGRPIGFREAAIRNLIRAVDMLPTFPIALLGGYAPALASVALSKRFQRLGDLAAGTIVIITERAGSAGPIRLVPAASPQELALIPDDVTLDAEERSAIELLLRRRGTLGPARENELASMLEDAMHKRFGLKMQDPVRMLALLYDRAMNAGRAEAPPSSMGPPSWR